MAHLETTAEMLRNRGVSRRDFLKFCAITSVALGLGPGSDLVMAEALSTKPRLPVLWINGLSCSCCTESFLRTAHPLATDIILAMIALDYQDTIMAAAGEQATAAYDEAISKYKGQYILAVEGNTPLNGQGMYCIDGGKPFMDKLARGVEHAKAVVAWGTCASWGCVQAASPNPTAATPLHKLFPNKPQLKVPGCPAIPEVMSAILAYIITYDRLPALDSQGRPEMFYGKRVHDQCYRRAHFDAGEYVESWDDEGARSGLCLYKMGCKGPTTYNACPATRWNNGVSFPIQSGHGCIGCFTHAGQAAEADQHPPQTVSIRTGIPCRAAGPPICSARADRPLRVGSGGTRSLRLMPAATLFRAGVHTPSISTSEAPKPVCPKPCSTATTPGMTISPTLA